MAFIPGNEWIVLYEFREFLRDNPTVEFEIGKGEKKQASIIFNELDELSSDVPQRGTIPFLYHKLKGDITPQKSEEAQAKLVNEVNYYINSPTFKKYVKPWGIMNKGEGGVLESFGMGDSGKNPQNLIFNDKVAKNLAYFFKKHSYYNFIFSISNSLFKKLLASAGSQRANVHKMLPLEMYMQPSVQKWIYIAVITTLFALFGLGGVVPVILTLIGLKGLALYFPVISEFMTFLTNSNLARGVSLVLRKLGLEQNSHFQPEFAPAAKRETRGFDIQKEGHRFKDITPLLHKEKKEKNMTNISEALGKSDENSVPEKNEHETTSKIVTMTSKQPETKNESSSSFRSFKK